MGYDQKFMEEAIALSGECFQSEKGGPFGAVVVQNGKIVGRGRNRVTADNDPTAHAEIQAIREACQYLKTFQLKGCEIYASCEPCPMCLGAIYWARPDVVYYAASRQDAAHAGFDDSFIYEEISLPTPSRKIPAIQHACPAAQIILEQWNTWKKKVSY
ncbi:MAG: nucleoside deaminase [Bacteroidales bacterium]|jgi:guanine deaminase|nr:nucleoside deaminase [Bacteroidales bacterium]